MDKLEKFLRKLEAEELQKIVDSLDKIKRGDVKGMDVKKLRGKESLFRVRIGRIRIIFVLSDMIRIISISKRSDTTYKKL